MKSGTQPGTSPARESLVQAILHSPSRMAALVVALVIILDIPSTIALAAGASQAQLAILVVVAPVTFLLGLFFVYRLWRRPTRTIIAVFLVVWVTPAVATIVGGGLEPGAIIPLGLDILAAVLAALALTEPRTIEASDPTR
jgi:hypothetical protein